MKIGTLQALLVLAFIVCKIAFDRCLVDVKISKSMYITWGAQHSSISTNGDDLQLVWDKSSGSAVRSKKAFLFGSIEMLIKLVPGNSAGTVTAYYVSRIINAKQSQFWNYENMGIPYPNKQGMRAYSSLWNANKWATRGGLEKIDWNSVPFKARLG
ncbi:hypothetical protein IFM89_008269 [Coptis chinensis]|uniref:GH16 domain-containing protein n=1 Tax=Coptis chinensis TaxID=261450 RepID=A0A835IA65_9MAGN|nr:hypothetical protein IFM89_008269 [Coptis chinensis]